MPGGQSRSSDPSEGEPSRSHPGGFFMGASHGLRRSLPRKMVRFHARRPVGNETGAQAFPGWGGLC